MAAFMTPGIQTVLLDTAELHQTASKLRALADTIERMARGEEADISAPISLGVINLDDAFFRAYARRELRIRRTLGDFFDRSLFVDPARDILFELFAAAEEGENRDLASCYAASGVPGTTALRWLNRLGQEGIVDFIENDDGGPHALVRLSPSAHETMRAYLSAAHSIPLGPHDPAKA